MVGGLSIQGKQKRPDESFVGIFHLPMQNCPKTESRICSTSTAPITSPTARNASFRSAARYSGDSRWLIAARARSPDSNARRRQSRWRVLIATALSGLRFCWAMRVADDHPVVAEKPVEQTRFTCIRGPVNHHPHAFAQDPALIGGGEQRGNSIANRIEP